MSTSFERDFDWQRGLIPEVKRILANYLICEAPIEEDMQRNTDLIVLKLDTIRVACRLRTPDFLDRYPDEFTIRASRPSGAKTELTKILEGWGDYIFYGFATADNCGLAAWMLGDLSAFRIWHHREVSKPPGQRRWVVQPNPDGSSTFHAYRIKDLSPEFLTARMIRNSAPHAEALF